MENKEQVNMLEVIILKGLPGSGKSTWAKKKMQDNPGKYKSVNKDALRDMLDSGQFSKDNESFVTKVRNFIIFAALEQGKNVIVDDTNFNPIHKKKIRDLAHGYAVVKIKEFNVDVDECIRRDAVRENSVGEKVIRSMYNKYVAIN